MDSKHTPGPWTFDPMTGTVYGPPHRHAQSVALGVEMENRPIIAFVRHQGSRSDSNANGYKLGAALELYEALEMMRDADEDCKRDGLPTIPAPARARIDAALAKADGGAA